MRKHDVLIVKFVLSLLCVFVFTSAMIAIPRIDLRTSAEPTGFSVVIDAGHGGKDRGASSVNAFESDIALAIALFLKIEFRVRGINVVMTRESTDWLASAHARNKKRDDLNKRREIIEHTRPDLVISIHLNNFPSDTSVRGLQCFYNPDNEQSKRFAQVVQAVFNNTESDFSRVAKSADYYILNATQFPAILIECGFLSNNREERMLRTREYQRIVAYYIALAVHTQLLMQYQNSVVKNVRLH